MRIAPLSNHAAMKAATLLVCFVSACSSDSPSSPGAAGGVGHSGGSNGIAGGAGAPSSGGAGNAGSSGSTAAGSAGLPGVAGAGGAVAGASAGGSAGSSGSSATGGSVGSGGGTGVAGGAGMPGGGGADGSGTCAGVLGHPTQPCDKIPTYPGVTLKFVDDFDTDLNLDTDPYWTYSDGFSDQAQARFVKSAVTFMGGSARITMNKPPAGAPTGPSYAEGTKDKYPLPFDYASPVTSGELRTRYNNFKYGYYEFRIKPPTNTAGNFIAAAFVFRTPKWQDWRELDIELQAAGKAKSVPTNVIVGENQGGWSPGISDSVEVPVTFDTQADFHTYGFDWEADYVKFYIDRATNPNPVRNYPKGSKLPIPNKSTKIMMNFWLFGSSALGGGDPAKNTYPMVMQIDYVRFYKSNDEPFYPCSPTPACLSDATHKEDLDYSKNNSTDGIPTSTTGL